jgi:hypothetical protein
MTKSLRNKMKTSEKLEVEGIELELGNCRLTLARAGGANQRYGAAMLAAHKKHGRAIDLDVMPDEMGRKIFYTIWAETVVKLWETDVAPEGEPPEWKEGIDDGNGGLLPFTVDNAVAFFLDVPDFFLAVKKTAEDAQYYRQKLLDDAVKN